MDDREWAPGSVQFPRPVVAPDVAKLAPAEFIDPGDYYDRAHRTALAVLNAARDGVVDGAALADEVGMSTLAELWRQADPASLPGALWTLYVVRAWCRSNADEVARLFRAGREVMPVDEVVAGAPELAGSDEVVVLADTVLSGAYRGDFAVALERAAAFLRVVAAGRLAVAPQDADEEPRMRANLHNARARALAVAAKGWRAGTLA